MVIRKKPDYPNILKTEAVMKNPLNKRYIRELRQDAGKYLALFLFLVLLIGFVSGYMVADGSLKKSYDLSLDKYNVEDGHFVLSSKAGASLTRKLEKKNVKIYNLYYKDTTLQNGHDIRIFRNRKTVNKAAYWKGRAPENDGEIAVDRLYAENNSLDTGNHLKIDGRQYKITGLAALSDYSALFLNNSDLMFDANRFTVAVVTDAEFGRIPDRHLHYAYAWKNNNQNLTDKEKNDLAKRLQKVITKKAVSRAKEQVEDDLKSRSAALQEEIMTAAASGDAQLAEKRANELKSLTSEAAVKKAVRREVMNQGYLSDFVKHADNQAITFSREDMGRDSVMMMMLLYIVIVIIAFIFAITTRSSIEQDAGAIGTLRASGYTRNELLRHYIAFPLIITAAAALIGNIIGYTGMKTVIARTYLHSYSLTPYRTYWNGQAFVLTTIIPCAIVLFIVWLILKGMLRYSPQQFLRGELTSNKNRQAVRLPDWKFPTRFRARIIIQNIPAYITLVIGILLSSVLMLFCLSMLPMLDHFKTQVEASSFAKYQYILKAPAATKVRGAEKYCIKTLHIKNIPGEDIAVYGITADSSYLNRKKMPSGKNEVLISRAYADKYRLTKGDTIRLKMDYIDKIYRFRVAGTYDYDASLAVFMPRNRFNSVFVQKKSYYTGYFSDKKLHDIDSGTIASIIKTSDLTRLADQLDDSMGSVFNMFVWFGILTYLIIIYLLSKQVLDRNARNIGMIKILGYDSREISRLYNRVTGIITIGAFLICIPIGNQIFRAIFRAFMMDYHGWFTYYIAPSVYVKLIVISFAGYFIVSLLQQRRIRRIPAVDVVKMNE